MVWYGTIRYGTIPYENNDKLLSGALLCYRCAPALNNLADDVSTFIKTSVPFKICPPLAFVCSISLIISAS
jgi:hypothetical protein